MATAARDLAVPESLAIRQPISRTTALGAPMPPAFLLLTVERTFASGTKTETYNIGVEGGMVSAAAGGATPFQTRFSVSWEGDRLVIWNASYSGSSQTTAAAEHLETWELDPGDRLVVTVVDRGINVDSTPNKALYRRQ